METSRHTDYRASLQSSLFIVITFFFICCRFVPLPSTTNKNLRNSLLLKRRQSSFLCWEQFFWRFYSGHDFYSGLREVHLWFRSDESEKVTKNATFFETVQRLGVKWMPECHVMRKRESFRVTRKNSHPFGRLYLLPFVAPATPR